MIKGKKRIRSLSANLVFVTPGETIKPCVKVFDRNKSQLFSVGFDSDLHVGTSVLPAFEMKPSSIAYINANGKENVRKDLPMETAYRQVEWEWEQWHGRDTITMSKIVDVPYKRYPREFIPPQSVELTLEQDSSGQLYVTTPAEEFIPANETSLLHKINLLLEIFGECEVLRADMTSFVNCERRSVNWRILPKGVMPWVELQKSLNPIIERQKEGKQKVIWARIKEVQRYNPDFYAVGQAGFNGYLVFGFEALGLYILESVHYGNATYVLDKDWEYLSQKTKAEILNNDLHYARLIHRDTWPYELAKLLRTKPIAKVA